MKFLCPACERLLDLERFSLEGGALLVTCQRCGATSRSAPKADAPTPAASPAAPRPPASAPAPAPRVALVSSPHASNVVTLKTATTEAVQRAAEAVPAAFEVPPGHCPKCVAIRGPGPSCPACGLSFDAFRPAMVEVPAWLKSGWVELLRDWGNDARHERLRTAASGRGALPELGRLYRLRLASVPDDPWASSGREEVQRLAQAAVAANLSTSRAPDGPGSRRWLLIVVVLAVAALASVALARMLLASQG